MRKWRHVRADGTRSVAVYSGDGAHRLRLSRRWGTGEEIAFVMLNPSTATEAANDPTLARCEARARAGGWGGMTVVNLFTLRTPDPGALFAHPSPVARGADRILRASVRRAGRVVCAWGADRRARARAMDVLAVLADEGVQAWCLGISKDGAPRHPLYVPARTAERPLLANLPKLIDKSSL
jgi:hypothetical protein